MRWRTIPVILACLGIGPAAAQQGQTPPLFRVTSTRVVVEFIAVDESGRFIDDFKLDEIEVKIGGKKQKADVLFPFGTVPQPVPLASFSNGAKASSPSAAAGAGRAEGSASARTVILLDSRVLDASNFNHSLRAIRGFIEEYLESDHMVMIAEVERDLKIRVPFTRDREKLLSAVGELTPSTVYNPLELGRFPDQSRDYVQELQQQPIQQLEADSRLGTGLLKRAADRQAASRNVGKLFKVPRGRERLQGLASQPLLASETLNLKPGKYSLVLAVEDRVSGSLGVGSQAFMVR